jgi:hypothetical protein
MTRTERIFLYGLLGTFFIVMFALAYFSEGTIESGDSYQHYIMSRYSFRHPQLFLDLWAKPFFTLLSAPFAQFGFLGINVFNILCAMLTGYFSYRIARMLDIKIPLLAVLFVVCAPVYFVVIISGLTEPLFGLVVIASIFLLMKGRRIEGAFLVSFLPMVRSEGNGLLLLFLLALLIRREWKAIPFLAAGTVLYSIIGYFYYKDILWIWHLHPYKGDSIYGKGDLLHFVNRYEDILGTPLSILMLAGLITLIVKLARSRQKPLHPFFTEEFFLIAGTFVLYVAGHSYVHWKGISGSSGTWRVLAGIMPVAGLLALRGFDAITSWLNNRIILYSIAALYTLWAVRLPFLQHEFPREPWIEEVPLAECADWIREQGMDSGKIYYFYPYLSYSLELDPYDTTRAGNLWQLQETEKSGTLVIWDSHFGPESGFPLSNISNDTSYVQLRTFVSEYPVTTAADGTQGYFEVHLFRKR